MENRTNAELLKNAEKEARSFPGITPPDNAYYIGSVQTPEGVFRYYQSENKNFYYDTEKGFAFAKEMDKLIKHKKRR